MAKTAAPMKKGAASVDSREAKRASSPGIDLDKSLHDGELDIEYHQDYRDGKPSNTRTSLIISSIIILPLIYSILMTFSYSLFTLPRLLGDLLVFLSPSSLLNVFENILNTLRLGIRKIILNQKPGSHSANSDTMSRIINLETPASMIDSIAQAGMRKIPSKHTEAQNVDERPAGLGNWDNSCYQNSVLQGLASLKNLSDYLSISMTEKSWELKESEIEVDASMSEALRGLIKTLNDPLNNGKRIWTPATLKNMSSWQQQDAQEYFSKVLDEIDKEISTAASLTKISPVFESMSRSTCLGLPSKKLRNPLEGMIAQRVGCTRCGHSEGLSLIPFNCLTVPLGRYREYDISQCLDEYTKLEMIEGVECRKCTLLKSYGLLCALKERMFVATDNNLARQQIGERLAAMTEALENDDYEDKTLLKKCKITSKNWVTSTKSRQAVIARPPKSLVIHFNRSLYDEVSGELKKNCCQVRFSRLLDIGPWCLGSTSSPEDTTTEGWILNPDQSLIASSLSKSRQNGPIYELRAVVTHYGRHENGHYVCYKKHPLVEADGENNHGQWWRLSDDEVMKVSEENVLGQGGVFMLFYDCVQSPETIVLGSQIKLPDQVNAIPALINGPSNPELHVEDSLPDSDKLSIHDDLSQAVNIQLPYIDDNELSGSEDQESTRGRHKIGITGDSSEPINGGNIRKEMFGIEPATNLSITNFPWKADDAEGKDANLRHRNIVSAGALVMV